MAASVVIFIIIIIISMLVVFATPYGAGLGTYFGIGCLAGLIAVVLTIILISVLYLKQRGTIRIKEDGFRYQDMGRGNSVPEVARHASKTYQTQVKSNNRVVAPGSACQCHNPPHSTLKCHNTPHSSLKRKVSACSDYTESHYYTEVDEYFINKRKAKQEQNFQVCYEEPGIHGEKKVPVNTNQMENSSYTYDYVYGRIPPKC